MNDIPNINIISSNRAKIEYNRRIYSADIVNSVAHFMIGKCQTYINQQGDKLIVDVISEMDRDIENIIKQFNEEIINYRFYDEMMKRKLDIRKTILEQVLTCLRTNKE